jgi:GT2 family glycosyltransferase
MKDFYHNDLPGTMTENIFPTVVVILVNYNSLSHTTECIQSLSQSSIKPFIVVIDNNSSDAEFLKSYGIEYDYGCHIIFNEENIGFGRANNTGIQWALHNIKFDYLLLLNNDTVVEKDALERLVNAFKFNPAIAITTSKIMYHYNKNLVWYGGGDINKKKCWPIIYDFNKEATTNGANKPKYATFVSGCVMMFSRSSIEKMKGFDDDFFMYCEDLELSIRTIREGYKMYYEPRSVIFHKVQASSANKENNATGYNAKNPNLKFLFYNMQVNLWKAYRKNVKGIFFLRFCVIYFIDFILKNLKFIISGNYSIVKVSFNVIKDIIDGRKNQRNA